MKTVNFCDVIILAALFAIGCDNNDGTDSTGVGTEESAERCSDDIDNDEDGATDCQDKKCRKWCVEDEQWDTDDEDFQNPVIWQDLADLEVIRVDDTYYYTASTMHYSPGAPILRSFDLVNWEYVGHSVPVLDWGSHYNLEDDRHAYVKGIWASTLGYRTSNQTFYWIGCIEFARTYIYTATSVEGPWDKHPPINNCYYDAGLLIDDDDTMYVAYGNSEIYVAELSDDGFSEVHTELVYEATEAMGMLEGARFYNIDGGYYIFVTHPADAEYVLRSENGPFGPYTLHPLLDRIGSPVGGSGVPHQGGIVETQNGDWYYMAFIDAYPGGRLPVLAPLIWQDDGWPILDLVDDGWGASYPHPDVPPHHTTKPLTGIDRFEGNSLGPEWEWNHNPDNAKWSLNNGLILETATVTDDLYRARNTLTHRILGPASTATIALDVSEMADGDQAGLSLLRDRSAWIGVRRSGDVKEIVMVTELTMDENWNTTSTGTVVESVPISNDDDVIWFRAFADIRPGLKQRTQFSYSIDGDSFSPIGDKFSMNKDWHFFMGYRFAVFNFATQKLGGQVIVQSFELLDDQ